MQDFLVYALVVFAAAYLMRRAYHRLNSGEGGNCPGCKGCGKPEPPKLIQLERRVPKR
ncbi:FeoB-associated Cys-rich membrane protein [Armatimonas sp.]|uniref:FeoB-associated Cys-rich membrane protein n=1 Tax=Armatimonas sp. TaxID=1872638 RepID=UPI00286B7FA1|nr:FeoB-associated Cys-rich membrane protein [Armatimonas sp.]